MILITSPYLCRYTTLWNINERKSSPKLWRMAWRWRRNENLQASC